MEKNKNLYYFYFQKQVLRCLAAWMDWAVYTPDFLFDLENVFLGNNERPSQPEVNFVQTLHKSTDIHSLGFYIFGN